MTDLAFLQSLIGAEHFKARLQAKGYEIIARHQGEPERAFDDLLPPEGHGRGPVYVDRYGAMWGKAS